MKLKDIKNFILPLRHTTLHPQWFINRNAEVALNRILPDTDSLVLDIGCAYKSVSKYIRNKSNYIGLNYYDTASGWYGTTPNIYTPRALPFANQTIVLSDISYMPYRHRIAAVKG